MIGGSIDPRCARLSWLGVALALCGCGVGGLRASDLPAPEPQITIGTQARCTPRFPDQDGWLGGDSAASVVLPGDGGGTSLWLFGDSFIAPPSAPTERSYPFVHNSIAVSHCDANGVWSLDYALGGTGKTRPGAAPRAFFEPDPKAAWVVQARSERDGEAYYWPISAAAIDDAVYVALLRVASGPAKGPLRLPFRLLGVDLARIDAPHGPPATWRFHYAALANRTDVFPASSLIASDEHLYAFAFLSTDDGRSPRVLTRLPIEALEADRSDLEDAVETLSKSGRWIPGLDPARARILMDDDASEMSVHFDPGLREWLAVYSELPRDTKKSLADMLWLRRAPQLTGPWSPALPLAHVPELAQRPDSLPGELFCYAAKAHPELARSAELLVTYVCNVYAENDDELSAVLERLRTTPSIYRPRALHLGVPNLPTSE